MPIKEHTVLYAQWAPMLERDSHIKYLNGYPDGMFRPDGSITRAEAASIFHRLIISGDKSVPADASLSDIESGCWYSQAVSYLNGAGIITGYPDGTFNPENPITKAEFAVIASRFDVLEAGAPGIYPDVSESHWAAGYVNNAYAKGWIGGTPGEGFFPDAHITRAQVVALVNRMLDRGTEPGEMPPDVKGYADLAAGHWAYCDIIEASVEHGFGRNEAGREIWSWWNVIRYAK
jgi:hypothetical protein